VLVPGDVIDILPDGTRVTGIDQIVIETENCEFTAQGGELTITMSDRGVPFRIRDGDNADITLEPDGTIVANGRSTLGESFPQEQRDNPDKLIAPIPVDPENDVFARGPNDTFPIISSTGIGGEGCRVVGDSRDGGGDAGNVDRNASIDDAKTNTGNAAARDGVISDTISDNPLPNTGGTSLLGPAVSGLAFIGVGFLFFRSAMRRNV
jgi:LPXTG-motif cell wall-anchored protein